MKHIKKEKKAKKQMGDVLGISETPGSTRIPQATTDHGGHPEGIELREYRRHYPGDSFRPSKGAEGIDMGAGGGGTDIEPEHLRPEASKKI